MANEQDRASITAVRGRQAARMSGAQRKKYIADSAGVDTDYQNTAEETAGVSKMQQTQDVLGSMKKGGKIKKTGLYRLHKGERVVPKSKAVKIGALMRAR